MLLEERDRPSEGLARGGERLHLQEAVRHSLAHDVLVGDASLFERGRKCIRLPKQRVARAHDETGGGKPFGAAERGDARVA